MWGTCRAAWFCIMHIIRGPTSLISDVVPKMNVDSSRRSPKIKTGPSVRGGYDAVIWGRKQCVGSEMIHISTARHLFLELPDSVSARAYMSRNPWLIGLKYLLLANVLRFMQRLLGLYRVADHKRRTRFLGCQQSYR